jgi:hypothetical protein
LQSRKQTRDSRALVVVNTATQKIQDILDENEIKPARQLALRSGFGTGAGYNAGGLVKIQKEVSR